MHILKKLTKMDLKLNKKRTIGTLIGIILSSALITAVLGMGVVFRNTLIKTTIEDTGYYHIQLSDIPIEDVELLKNNRDYSHIEVVKDLGRSIVYKKNDKNDSEFKYDTNHVYSMNENSFKYLKHKIIKGRFPTNKDEALVPYYYLEDLNLKIGDKITLDIGEIVLDETDTVKNSFQRKKIINNTIHNFTITGVIGDGSTVITTFNDSDKNDVYLTLKNPKNYRNDFKELLGCRNTTYCHDKYNDYYVNRDILRWEVFDFNESTLSFLYGIISIVIGVILFTSIFSIKNSFAISTTEKKKMYGMLRSVGSTKKQIKNMVLYEGFVLGFIGLLVGSILGTLVTYLLTLTVNLIIKNTNLLYYKFSIIPIFISYLVGIIMIYLSSMPNAKKASIISPIDNIRDNDTKNIKLKVPSLINKIFKIGGTLSYKNLKRSKKKYRVTVISLTVSIFIFITVSSFSLYVSKSIKDGLDTTNYDLAVYVNPKSGNLDIEKILNLAESHVEYAQNEGYYSLFDTSHITNKNMISHMCEILKEDYNCAKETEGVYVQLQIYDDKSFKEIAKKINASYDKIKDKAIVINYRIEEDSNTKKKELKKSSDYKIGDDITLKNPYTLNEITYEVGALTDYKPWGVYGHQFTIIVDKDYYKKDDIDLSTVYFISKDTYKLEKQIKEINPNYNIYNADAELKETRNFILIISIFVYGFIIVVTFIGLTSVFNTITSNMELRQKDFATLKSIGMTKKEFNNMITLESFFYSFKSLFYGIILGLIGSYFVYKVFVEEIDYGYLFPYKPILISIIFILVVVLIIMKYSIKKINKQNIIETIRNNNI